MAPPVIGCFAVAAFCVALMIGMVFSGDSSKTPARMAETNSIEYRVNLRPGNGVTGNPYLERGLTYAFDIIENIEVENAYESKLSQPTAIQYDYEAAVSFVARVTKDDQKTDNIIVDEVIETLHTANSGQTQGDFSLTESFSLDLTKYRKKFQEVKNNLNFPIMGEIRVDFTVKNSLNVTPSDTYKGYVRSIVIPVSEPYFQIELKGEETQQTGNAAPAKLGKTKLLMLGIIFIIGAGAGLLGLYLVFNPLDRKASRKREVERLLRNYRDMIIVATTPINPAAYKERVTVKDSKEILKLAANLNEPIIYYEAQNVACFYIPKNGILYAYLINK